MALEPCGPSAKRVLVDIQVPDDAVQELKALAPSAIDLTVQQLRVLLQAFGKTKLSSLTKIQLKDMLHNTLTAGCEIVHAEKMSKVRELILDW